MNNNSIFEKKSGALSKVEEALKPIVNKYGTTDEHDFSKITNAKETNTEKLQAAIIEEDDTINSLDFVDENGVGMENIDEEVDSMESLLNGITDEEDLQGIQAELTAMMDEIDKIAQNTYNAVNEIAGNSNGITKLDTQADGINGSYSVSIGDKDVAIDVMDMDSKSLGLRDIDVTQEGGLQDAFDKINSAKDKLAGGLNYLGDVKQNINDTFEDYKSTLDTDTVNQLNTISNEEADNMLAQIKADADVALLAQMNQDPKFVLSVIE